MSTPGHFAFGNDHDGWQDAITLGQYRRMVEKQGHPPMWKPNHYRPTGPLSGDECQKPHGRKASHLRSAA